MKTSLFRLTVLFVIVVQFFSCDDLSVSSYKVELPKTLEYWVSLLGEPNWCVEWVDPGGWKQVKDIKPGEDLKIEIPVTWTNPITAWPYWPEHNLIPGLFKPAGALFPFDVNGNSLCLTWEAGPDTVFYWELALANEGDYSRIPANFDWPRFRELFDGLLGEAVCEDPWLVNWRSVAERTVSSNFDRRRLVPEAVELKPFPVPAGPWYGSSPFAGPLIFEEGKQPVFPVRSGFNVWISAEGILRVNGNAWVFYGN